jgi:hypothetical protein
MNSRPLVDSANYGDEVVMAALYGRNTELSKGNMDLGKYGIKGRSGMFRLVLVQHADHAVTLTILFIFFISLQRLPKRQ